MKISKMLTALTSALLIGVCSCACGIGGKEKIVMKEKPQYVIDVRSQSEFDAGHVEGALLIPHTEIGARIAQAVPDKNGVIALYCRSGHRAGLAKDVMEGMGYKNVTNLGGLSDAAETLGCPVVK